MTKNFLDQIISAKKIEIVNNKKKGRDFFRSVTTPCSGDIGLIAEIKLASPSAGKLGDRNEAMQRAKHYEQGGADALSVVADKNFFAADMKLLSQIAHVTGLPVLCKDFVIDEYQIYEAKMYRADALLLIAQLLSAVKLNRMVRLVRSLGMEPVVEISEKKELKKAVKSGAKMIAVNARSFSDLSVDVSRACRVLRLIPDTYVKLGFSGINTREDVAKYKQAGAKGVLVGTSLMRAKNIGALMQKLKGYGKGRTLIGSDPHRA